MLIKHLKEFTVKKTRKAKKILSTKLGVDYYLIKREKLLKEKDRIGATEVLNKGLRRFPKSIKITTKLAELAIKEKEWETAIEWWEKVYELEKSKRSIKVYLQLAIAYRKAGYLYESEKIILKGIKQSRDNEELWNAYAYIALFKYEWELAISRLEKLCKIYESKKIKAPMIVYFRLSTSYQMVGKIEKANQILDFTLDYYKAEINKDKHGYRKFKLFDNGESRIEFYKALRKTNQVMITFDSINMVWDDPSFAFNLLIKQNVDIVAVRKKRTKTYQQDLSLKDFIDTVNLLVEGYKDKIAYGFSLGAYGALYYASTLNCRILALSPRLSIHPQYGKEKMKGRFEFNHNNLPAYNSNITPIIVFDPKNKLDNTYINEGLLRVFPNANLVKVPYGGHGMGPHLLKMGLLKEFLLTVIHTEDQPKYRKELRKKSFAYYRELGNACLKRNKLRWALQLAEHALYLAPEDDLSIRLKINTLSKLERYREAITFADKSKNTLPDNRIIRLLLIDLYLDIGNIQNANLELQQAIKRFGNTKALLKRLKEINEYNFQ